MWQGSIYECTPASQERNSLEKKIECLRTDVRCLEEELHRTTCKLSKEKREKIQAVQNLEEIALEMQMKDKDLEILKKTLAEAKNEASELREQKEGLVEEMASMRWVLWVSCCYFTPGSSSICFLCAEISHACM